MVAMLLSLSQPTALVARKQQARRVQRQQLAIRAQATAAAAPPAQGELKGGSQSDLLAINGKSAARMGSQTGCVCGGAMRGGGTRAGADRIGPTRRRGRRPPPAELLPASTPAGWLGCHPTAH